MSTIQKGFSLIECLVYCFLSLLLGTLLFNWVSSTQALLVQSRKQCQLLVDRAGIFDVWSSDIVMAPSNPAAWKKIDRTHVVWQGTELDIGWLFEGNALYRITGSYSNGAWNHATKSLISNSTKQASFSVLYGADSALSSVTLTCDGYAQNVTLYGSKKYHGRT